MNSELLKRTISSIIFLPIVIFAIVKGTSYFNILLIFSLFISIYEWFLMSKNNKFFYPGVLFLFLSFYTIYLTRFNINEGYSFFLLVLSICIATDLGGFFFGKFFKGPKLTKISPKKTYTGMIGSFIFPIIFMYIFLEKTSFISYIDFNIKIFFFIILISAISQLGDLTVSYFKRISNLKDTGKIIPGHGGLLDRIDGIIFAFPISYLIVFILSINYFK